MFRGLTSRWCVVYLAACLAGACGDDQPVEEDGNGGSNGGDPYCPGAREGNRAPVINGIGPQLVLEGETLEVSIRATDPDNDTLYLRAEDLPEGADFDPVSGTLTYTPGFDLVSREEDQLTLPDVTVIVDDYDLCASTTISITVADVNRLPFFLSTESGPLSEIDVLVEPGTEARVTFEVVDPDGDIVNVLLEGSPAYARLEGSTLVLAPTEADAGQEHEFDIAATDGADTVRLPVRAEVGGLDVDTPAPQGLSQRDPDGVEVAAGGTAYEGRFTFAATPHTFEYGSLRLQVEVAAVGEAYEDGQTGVGELAAVGAVSEVELPLVGGQSYRWRARYLSDDFGPGPYVNFGSNAENEADLEVSIVPETSLDVVPHDPGPRLAVFEFSSPNVSDFQCKLDAAAWESCSSPKTYLSGQLPVGTHTFMVRAVTRDGLPDPTPESFTWAVMDVAEPNTSISGSPPTSVSCDISFTFTADLADTTFECRLDKEGLGGFQGDFLPCESPKSYTGLRGGDYRFHVRAINVVGVADSTPATHAFVATCSD